MADHISVQDFGTSMYIKPSGNSNFKGQNTENQINQRGKENKYLRVGNEERVYQRKSTDFGNISVKNLQQSLNYQLNEKKDDVENDRQPPTDTGEYRDLMQAQRKGSLVPENKGQEKTKISKEKVDLNKSVIIKKPLLDDLSGVSVKDLSSSVIRLFLKKEADEERPKSDQGDADSYELQHKHCLSCFDKRCSKIKDCPVNKCKNQCCEASFHKCKQREHDELCKYKIIRCVNETLGCQMEMPRNKLAYHLQHCTKMQQQQPETLHPSNFDKRVSRHPSDLYSRPSLVNKKIHEHCLYCFCINCPQQKECVIKKCPNAGCSMQFHGCKIKEHKRICQFKEISCINKQHGCEYRFSRILLTEHLRECPAMNFEALSLPPYNLFQNKEQSHHCDSCFRRDCTVQVGYKCALKECYCGAKLHACKMRDHLENICPVDVMPCINQQSGCKMFLTRCMVTTHLMHCPAMNWGFRKLDPDNKTSDQDYLTPVSSNNEDKCSDGSDEHIYEKLPKRKKKRNKMNNCKVM